MNPVKYYVIVVAMYASALSWSGPTPTAFEKFETKVEIAYEGECKPCQEAVLNQVEPVLLIPQLDSSGIKVIMSVDTLSVPQ